MNLDGLSDAMRGHLLPATFAFRLVWEVLADAGHLPPARHVDWFGAAQLWIRTGAKGWPECDADTIAEWLAASQWYIPPQGGDS
jgi:hypothetical protein